jgi:hypothetical protein
VIEVKLGCRFILMVKSFPAFCWNDPTTSTEKTENRARPVPQKQGVRIPINSDTYPNPFRKVFQFNRSVVGAKRRSGLLSKGHPN